MVMDLWAAFCVREAASFETFCAGCDAMLERRDLWERRGFRALLDWLNGQG